MRRPSRALACAGVALAMLMIGPLARTHGPRVGATIDRVALPAIADCEATPGWTTEWKPMFVEPDFSVARSYQCDGYRLHVSVVQYVEQHQGKEASGEFNRVIPRGWWNSTERRRGHLNDDVSVNEYIVDRRDSRMTIWNWYVVGDDATASPYGVKALEAWNALRFRGAPTTNITVAVEAGETTDATPWLATDAAQVWMWFLQQRRPA
jgi:EpsI family protein